VNVNSQAILKKENAFKQRIAEISETKIWEVASFLAPACIYCTDWCKSHMTLEAKFHLSDTVYGWLN